MALFYKSNFGFIPCTWPYSSFQIAMTWSLNTLDRVGKVWLTWPLRWFKVTLRVRPNQIKWTWRTRFTNCCVTCIGTRGHIYPVFWKFDTYAWKVQFLWVELSRPFFSFVDLGARLNTNEPWNVKTQKGQWLQSSDYWCNNCRWVCDFFFNNLFLFLYTFDGCWEGWWWWRSFP